jgi:hypothetical protein
MEERMKTATNYSPVAIQHPVTGQYVTISRGDEIDDPAILEAKNHAWLFEDVAPPEDVRSVPIEPIEQATRAPGERSRARRDR